MAFDYRAVLDRMSRWAAGAQVVLLFVLGFGLQTYTTAGTCVAEIENTGKTTANYAGLLATAALAFVLECVRDRQTSMMLPSEKAKAEAERQTREQEPVTALITAPAGPRLFYYSADKSPTNWWIVILEVGCVLAHLGTWISIMLLNGPVHTAIDTATVCATASVELVTYADINLAIAVASAVIWLIGVFDYLKNRSKYEDTVQFHMMNIRLGQLMRLIGAIGILIVSGIDLGRNFKEAELCKTELVYPFTSIAMLVSIGIFFWSFYGCDQLVPSGEPGLVKVSSYTLSRILSAGLLFTTVAYYMLTKGKTKLERGCPDTGWSEVEKRPFQAFIISLVMLGVELIVTVVINQHESYDGRLWDEHHGVQTTKKGGPLPMTGGGLKPATDMQTLRLTHDGPDKKPSSLSFV